MSLSNLLGIARSALLAQQRAMDLTAQNVANAQTSGYVRRRLVLHSAGLSTTSGTTAGMGLLAGTIERLDDPFLSAAYRRESGSLGDAATLSSFLRQVEASVNEPSDTGVAAALDGLFQAFGDLANSPTGTVEREGVRSAAQRLVQRMHALSGSITDQASYAAEMLATQVNEVNDLAARIAELNGKIAVASQGAGASPDLLDQRDRFVDQLSEMLAVKVEAGENGSITVIGGDTTLVDGGHAEVLEVVSGERGLSVATAGGTEIDPLSGSMQALTELIGGTLPDLQSRLDRLAEALVTEVNALHRTGSTADGATGVDFFESSGVTAATIELSGEVKSSTGAIAAGRSGEPGDNSLALELAALAREGIDALGSVTFSDFYAAFAAAVGNELANASVDQTASEVLKAETESLRSSASGVSVDEEMVNLIAQQEAYSAAARLVNVADEIIQTLLEAVG
jgi:flagellar hook-associated protein 1 FlgK